MNFKETKGLPAYETENEHGRASGFNPPNRFLNTSFEPLELENDFYEEEEKNAIKTTFFKDATKTILAKNDSPDIPFTYSLNPYRGCEHGCIYCYARPTHEYLGFSAGLDFETKIMVKEDAPQLLEEAFQKKNWKPSMIALSGNTDCYQPIERKLEITRKCLEVFLKYRNPVGIVTKNALIQRDIDILQKLAEHQLVHVLVSVTSLNNDLTNVMEPRTSRPEKRLETIAKLAEAKIPVGVNVAPIIPGLNDEEIPSILKAASLHGAMYAGYIIVRLPYSVEPLFVDWLNRNFPDRAKKITNHLKEMRGGKLNNAEWGKRFRGEGKYAEMIDILFKKNSSRYGLNKHFPNIRYDSFLRDEKEKQQLKLF
ncbi:MAG: PA0069 family radical SAM protein [Ignavibacteriales bacterium]|nr:PA0069 family radical SAM protein [Ignavibacteriales bacterium]